MKRKKLSLNKLTLGYLTDIEQARVIGGDFGGASNLYVNTVCATPTTNPPITTISVCCSPQPSSCKTAPYASCTI